MSHIIESRGFKILSQYRMVDSTTQRLNGSTSHRLGASIPVVWCQGHANALPEAYRAAKSTLQTDRNNDRGRSSGLAR